MSHPGCQACRGTGPAGGPHTLRGECQYAPEHWELGPLMVKEPDTFDPGPLARSIGHWAGLAIIAGIVVSFWLAIIWAAVALVRWL